jgi:hypothetical protein
MLLRKKMKHRNLEELLSRLSKSSILKDNGDSFGPYLKLWQWRNLINKTRNSGVCRYFF